jgi:reductive dehalogenase
MGLFNSRPGVFALFFLFFLGLGGVIFFFRRTRPNEKALKGAKGYVVGETGRFDERDHVFARNRSLLPGSEQYAAYYRDHPEWEDMDAKRREKGGPTGRPGSIDSPNADANVAATLASASLSHYLSEPDKYSPEPHIALREKVTHKKVEMGLEEATTRIKGYAKALGVSLVGVTKINPLWVYSHRGEIFNNNWEDWGKTIHMHHGYAIVCVEEMNKGMVGSAPHTPTCIESMINYAKGSYITTQLAGYIANMGYSATANHFRHYDTILTPLAADAGLGEVGRLGYLITKKYGPRVRLSIVTTDLELIEDKPVDIGVEDFCKICKKCAVCCPSNSISHEEMTVAKGLLRWKLDAQSCFEYWGKVGTDCNVCMNVCPWSHADTFPHQIIKTLITRNRYARKLFNLMDDIFYGKKPKPKSPEKWAQFGTWK